MLKLICLLAATISIGSSSNAETVSIILHPKTDLDEIDATHSRVFIAAANKASAPSRIAAADSQNNLIGSKTIAWTDGLRHFSFSIVIQSPNQRLLTFGVENQSGGMDSFSGNLIGQNLAFDDVWLYCLTSSDQTMSMHLESVNGVSVASSPIATNKSEVGDSALELRNFGFGNISLDGWFQDPTDPNGWNVANFGILGYIAPIPEPKSVALILAGVIAFSGCRINRCTVAQ